MSISDRELRVMADKLRNSAQVIVGAGVAKMFVSSPDPLKKKKPEPGSFVQTLPQMSSQEWTETKIEGACLLVYDLTTFILGFQIWNLSTLKPKFSYELYYDIHYRKLTSEFHAFEIDDCVLGFAFSSIDVAENFYEVTASTLLQFSSRNQTSRKLIDYGLLSQHSKGEINKKQKPRRRNLGWGRKKDPGNESFLSLDDQGSQLSRNNFNGLKTKVERKEKQHTRRGLFRFGRSKKTKKADVKNEQKVAHVRTNKGISFNYDGSLDLKSLSPEMKALFIKAGIKKKDLKNPAITAALMGEIQKQEMIWSYKEQEKYKDLSPQQLNNAVEESLGEYNAYLQNLHRVETYKRKEEDKKAQIAQLLKWEEQHAPPLPVRPNNHSAPNAHDGKQTTDIPPAVPERSPSMPDRIPAPAQRTTRTNAASFLAHNESLMGRSEVPSARSSVKPKDEKNKMFELPPPSPSSTAAKRRAAQKMETLIPGSSSQQRSVSNREGLRKGAGTLKRAAKKSNTYFSQIPVNSKHAESYNPRSKARGNRKLAGSKSRSTKTFVSETHNSYEQEKLKNVPPPTPLRKMKKRVDTKKFEVPLPEDNLFLDDIAEEIDVEEELRLSGIPPPPPPPPEDDTPGMNPVLNLALPELVPSVYVPSMKKPPSMNNFLNQIKGNNFGLKEVEGGLEMTMKRVKKRLEENSEHQNTLLGKLRKQLLERRNQIQDESESDHGDSESDWSIDN